MTVSGARRILVPEAKVENPKEVALAIVHGAIQEAVEPDAVYVGNVDYSVTADMLQEIFSPCGELLRVTIPRNKTDHSPMGFAYLKFNLESTPDAVGNARSLDGIEIGGRKLKVTEKRLNVPGLKTRCPYTAGHEHKESAPKLRAAPVTHSAGDWVCPTCGAKCHAKRFECFKCRTPRDKNSADMVGPMRNRISPLTPPNTRQHPYDTRSTARRTGASPPLPPFAAGLGDSWGGAPPREPSFGAVPRGWYPASPEVPFREVPQSVQYNFPPQLPVPVRGSQIFPPRNPYMPQPSWPAR
jgi:RNA recognition motif-containing protein